MPYGDVDFRNKKCIMFVRSQEVLPDDCKLGGCMQVNAHELISIICIFFLVEQIVLVLGYLRSAATHVSACLQHHVSS